MHFGIYLYLENCMTNKVSLLALKKKSYIIEKSYVVGRYSCPDLSIAKINRTSFLVA